MQTIPLQIFKGYPPQILLDTILEYYVPYQVLRFTYHALTYAHYSSKYERIETSKNDWMLHKIIY